MCTRNLLSGNLFILNTHLSAIMTMKIFLIYKITKIINTDVFSKLLDLAFETLLVFLLQNSWQTFNFLNLLFILFYFVKSAL